MRNKKKVISIIVALAMTAASLTACGSGGKGAERIAKELAEL